jgi:putative acetyltransferase
MSSSRKQSAVEIRLAGIDDAAEVALILRLAFAEYQMLYTAAAYAATVPTEEQIEERWDEGPVWIAFSEKGSAGTISAVAFGTSLYLRSLGIVPEARGQNLGRLLLEEAKNYARQNGFKRLFLSTTPFLHHAIRLYKQFGFVRTRGRPGDLKGTPLFTMTMALKPETEQLP